MTKVSTELARQIAANPDGCTRQELSQFIDYVGGGYRPIEQARCLFPDAKKPMAITIYLRDYCVHKAKAMECREVGRIGAAQGYERICEELYTLLPKSHQW